MKKITYTVLVGHEGDYRPQITGTNYEHAHCTAERWVKDGQDVQVVQHGRMGDDCMCCTSHRGALVQVI